MISRLHLTFRGYYRLFESFLVLYISKCEIYMSYYSKKTDWLYQNLDDPCYSGLYNASRGFSKFDLSYCSPP